MAILILAGLKFYAMRSARQNVRVEAGANEQTAVLAVTKRPNFGNSGSANLPATGTNSVAGASVGLSRETLPSAANVADTSAGSAKAAADVDPNLSASTKSDTALESVSPAAGSEKSLRSDASRTSENKPKTAKEKLASRDALMAPISPFKIGGSLGIQIQLPGSGSATSLDIVGIKLTSSQPLLLLQTNAAVGEKVSVHIRARSGDVLKIPSFDRNYLLTRIAGEGPGLDLAKLNLSPGLYHIEASSGEMKNRRNFSLVQRIQNSPRTSSIT